MSHYFLAAPLTCFILLMMLIKLLLTGLNQYIFLITGNTLTCLEMIKLDKVKLQQL